MAVLAPLTFSASLCMVFCSICSSSGDSTLRSTWHREGGASVHMHILSIHVVAVLLASKSILINIWFQASEVTLVSDSLLPVCGFLRKYTDAHPPLLGTQLACKGGNAMHSNSVYHRVISLLLTKWPRPHSGRWLFRII